MSDGYKAYESMTWSQILELAKFYNEEIKPHVADTEFQLERVRKSKSVFELEKDFEVAIQAAEKDHNDAKKRAEETEWILYHACRKSILYLDDDNLYQEDSSDEDAIWIKQTSLTT